MKKRVPRRKAPRKFGPVTEARAKQIATKVLEGMAELKHNDSTIALAPDTDDTRLVNVSAIPRGVADNERIGDRIKLNSIQMNATLDLGDSTNVVRFVVVQWHLDDTVVNPSLNALLQDPTNIHSAYTIDKQKRFTVLYDKILYVDTYSPQKKLKFFINKGFKKTIEYTNNANNGVDKIFYLYMSDSAAAPHPGITGYSRLRYYDL